MIPTFIIYWIFQSFDRIMITQILDSAQTGIYSVGARVASISQILYIAFATGWQYFAFSTMHDSDQVKLTSKIFQYTLVISLLVFIVFAPFSKLIFAIIFKGDYVFGYLVFPYLLVSPLLLISFQVITNQFLVIKKTLPATFILSGGAIVNILLNFILISKMGIEGAAISTFLGYVTSILIACIVLSRMKLIIINNKILYVASMYLGYVIIWRFITYDNIVSSLLLAVMSLLILVIIFRIDIIDLKNASNQTI